MNRIRTIRIRVFYIILTAIIYFCCDYFIYKTAFLKSYSFVGIKSFIPMIAGLNFGPYGIIGELLAITISNKLTGINISFYIMECIIVVVMGLGTWFLWHIQSYTHRIRFRFISNYLRYLLISFFLSFVCGIIGIKLINIIAFQDILIWNISMSVLVGIPIEIIYSSLMNLDPILPPIKVNGKRIVLKNDIEYTVDKDPQSLAALNEKLELLLEKRNENLKKVFEIQNVIEEVYLRIIQKCPNALIDIIANSDVTFSVEFIYIAKKFNPFKITKKDDKLDVAGLNIIKHRALLAHYSYNYGLNTVHIVI